MSNKETKVKQPITKLAIAKDALKLLRLKRIVAENGRYFGAPDLPGDGGNDVQAYLARTDGPPCAVCARGALLCGLVKRVDGFKFYDSYFAKEKELLLSFTMLELEQIESAFESYAHNGIDYQSYRRRRGIHEDLSGDQKALRSILRNIVAGNGEFDPNRYLPGEKAKGGQA